MQGNHRAGVEGDAEHMLRALDLARQGRHVTPPNPSVGCVLVADGRVAGEGHTRAAGQAHAEVVALEDAARNGASVRGAIAYVTLEPCSHHGRTPPCADALVRAGVARVVVAVPDPNPVVAGRGIEWLRAAGIQVDVGLFAEEARELNLGFFSRMLRKRPWVRMKIAASLDGRTALESGQSQWITSAASRADGHCWRARAGAVLTGIGTVIEDDPRLDVREIDTPRQPLRVIIDSRLETPTAARILRPPGDVLIYAATEDDARGSALRAAGAEIRCLPNPAGKVDLAIMLEDLAHRGVNELHVEAGQKLNGSFVREDLVDEYLVYLAPKLLGQGQGMMNFGPLADLKYARALEFTDTQRVGPDLRIIARPPNRAQF